MVKAFSGRLDFDPAVDSIGDFTFQPPPSTTLPKNGYRQADYVYTAPPADRSSAEVNISLNSQRIQRLAPFAAWDSNDYLNLPILIKVEGKCTTDHITPAGPWFRYRGTFSARCIPGYFSLVSVLVTARLLHKYTNYPL
jgi:aconitate hydratase